LQAGMRLAWRNDQGMRLARRRAVSRRRALFTPCSAAGKRRGSGWLSCAPSPPPRR
jgi:hypothetical protein